MDSLSLYCDLISGQNTAKFSANHYVHLLHVHQKGEILVALGGQAISLQSWCKEWMARREKLSESFINVVDFWFV